MNWIVHRMRVPPVLLPLLLLPLVSVLSASLQHVPACSELGCLQSAAPSASDSQLSAADHGPTTQLRSEQNGGEDEEVDEDDEMDEDDDDEDDEEDREDIEYSSEAVAVSENAAEVITPYRDAERRLVQSDNVRENTLHNGLSTGSAAIPQEYDADVFAESHKASPAVGSVRSDLSPGVDNADAQRAVGKSSPPATVKVTAEDVVVLVGGVPTDGPATRPESEEEEDEEEDEEDDEEFEEEDEDDDEDPSEDVAEHPSNESSVLSGESIVISNPTSEATAGLIADEVQTLDALTAALGEVENAFRALEKMPLPIGDESSKDVFSVTSSTGEGSTTNAITDHPATPDGDRGQLVAEASGGKSGSTSLLANDEVKAINALVAALGEVKMAFVNLAETLAVPTLGSHPDVIPEMKNLTDTAFEADTELKHMAREADKVHDKTKDGDNGTDPVFSDAGDPHLPSVAGASENETVTIDTISAKELRALNAMTAALRHVTAAFHNIKRLANGNRATSVEESLSHGTTGTEEMAPPLPTNALGSGASGVHLLAVDDTSASATVNGEPSRGNTTTEVTSGNEPASV